MSKINLLPWREALKKVKNQVFYVILGSLIAVSMLVTVLMDRYINYKVAVENANIEYINKELKKAKEEVAEVKSLQHNKKQLLERMNIIQSLQADRPSAVKLFDILPRVLPEGLYLANLSRKDAVPEIEALPTNEKERTGEIVAKKTGLGNKKYRVVIQGVALTNGSISVFLKNLEKIKWISEVKLNEVSINKEGDGLNFNLGFTQNLIEGE
ncbi:MAG TPA: PilN domain-containing protein [Gammaproteobacteria bacterium]|nr:PilN domain-containing protein [Gammaproteobacteria bacterium]